MHATIKKAMLFLIHKKSSETRLVSRDENLVPRDETLVLRDETLVSREPKKTMSSTA